MMLIALCRQHRIAHTWTDQDIAKVSAAPLAKYKHEHGVCPDPSNTFAEGASRVEA